VVVFKAFADLGSESLSPFPSPPKGAALKMDGIYSQMRHPMYTGLLMVMAGLSIASNSADRLLLTGLLWYLLEVKADKEEGECCMEKKGCSAIFVYISHQPIFCRADYLMEEYGQEYSDYKAAVPGKFVPEGLLDDMPWNKS
jgi:protein-S-isoprenylcysteine O-methyltransferase Ste14